MSIIVGSLSNEGASKLMKGAVKEMKQCPKELLYLLRATINEYQQGGLDLRVIGCSYLQNISKVLIINSSGYFSQAVMGKGSSELRIKGASYEVITRWYKFLAIAPFNVYKALAKSWQTNSKAISDFKSLINSIIS